VAIGFASLRSGCYPAGMFRLFAQLGRARELRLLDEEFRAAGLHPILVPEAVKMTIVRLLKQEGGVDRGSGAAMAVLLSYCMLGEDGFERENGPDLAAAVEQRLGAAIDAGDSLDARLVLLALHAGLVKDAVIERFRLAVE